MRDDKTIITVSLTLEAKRNLDRLADEYTNGNRSAWVQRAIDTSAMVRFLKDLDHTGSEAHRKNRIDGKCNPQLVPKCAICWEMNAWVPLAVTVAPNMTAMQHIERKLPASLALIANESGRLMLHQVKRVNNNYGSSSILARAEVILWTSHQS